MERAGKKGTRMLDALNCYQFKELKGSTVSYLTEASWQKPKNLYSNTTKRERKAGLSSPPPRLKSQVRGQLWQLSEDTVNLKFQKQNPKGLEIELTSREAEREGRKGGGRKESGRGGNRRGEREAPTQKEQQNIIPQWKTGSKELQ